MSLEGSRLSRWSDDDIKEATQETEQPRAINNIHSIEQQASLIIRKQQDTIGLSGHCHGNKQATASAYSMSLSSS
ncbi:hypothetical protein E2C01_060390 [Portunus trituberculatus]|uniref:Uncharacterized protein n=1 Tax=Portunus trituberculatus TaxID=210409 RepID=A0A5B7H543_PORTR|nr:hypothetical protein [Portunus trituberculatus]